VIGCGVIGPDHFKAYAKCENVKVKWACDCVENKAVILKDRFAIEKHTTDYRDILHDPEVDCVSVCTDHGSHASIVCDSLKAGKHVLCEKALSSSRNGLAEMLATHAGRSDLVFSGVFQHRFDPVYRYIKYLLEEGRFGTLLTVSLQMMCFRSDRYYIADDWRGTWEREGGALLINQSIHFIDMIGWLSGGIAAVNGAWANLSHKDVMETEDTAVAAIEYECGALGTIEATSSSNIDWEPTITVRGTEGSLDIRNARPLRVCFKDREQEREITSELDRRIDGSSVGPQSKSYYGPSHPSQIADFIDAIRENRPPFVTARSACHAVDVVLSIYDSFSSGKRVVIDSLKMFRDEEERARVVEERDK